ncbi:VOC family protein [Kordia algicida OT-1]|uniref:Glyoxalase/bleomycin resistance protein/dioxygenase n=1 Tax=Kordia algicida OT-1 TaxID=391587 RepID=A9DPV4_9FLAO|nr:VOC family protein [Kordia algicida]EDP97530.1 Glyoxalase/bleomycin resistance protein/dioxygenase [Kordia algicida OT-1]
MKNAITWFEIPVTNYERAKRFYSEILGGEIKDHHMEDQNMKYGIFPYDMENHKVGGALMQMEGMNPSKDGSTVYLYAGEDLSDSLGKVEAAGGKIVMPKTDINENGFIAQFIDTEGNRVALHSMN